MNKNLKLKIVEKFGSQAEFSTRILEDETVISRIILGRRKLSNDRQQAWAKILNCKVHEIFPDAEA